MLRPSHERTAWLNPTAGLARVEGTAPHWARGTRWTPATSSAPKAQVSPRRRSRRTTRRGGGPGTSMPSSPWSETQSWAWPWRFTSPARTRPERCGTRCTGRGVVTSATARVRNASDSRTQAEDQDADPLALGDGVVLVAVAPAPRRDAPWPVGAAVGQPGRPLRQVSLGGRPVEEAPRRGGERRAVAAVHERVQLRAAPVAGDADAVPAAFAVVRGREAIAGAGVGRQSRRPDHGDELPGA